MALIKCKKCGHMISDRTKFCPHCGCPKEFSIKEESSTTEDTPISEETYANNKTATTTQDIEEYDIEKNTGNGVLLRIVVVITIVALIFAAFLFGRQEDRNHRRRRDSVHEDGVRTAAPAARRARTRVLSPGAYRPRVAEGCACARPHGGREHHTSAQEDRTFCEVHRHTPRFRLLLRRLGGWGWIKTRE